MRLLVLLVLLSPAWCLERVQGWCSVGAKPVVTSSFNSTTKVQASYPSCTVTVTLVQTAGAATLYSDNTGDSLSNPFTAASDGSWYFYVTAGRYNVTISGGGLAAPFTFGDITATDDVNVLNYGADPSGNSDSTAAIAAAITAVQNWPVIPSGSLPCIHFPAGTYVVSGNTAQIFHITFNNLCITGDSPWNTIIQTASDSTIIFNLGTFSATVSNPYVGGASSFTLENIRLINPSKEALTYTGSRTTVGVQANGQGQILIQNVQCEGLQYCFAAPYGSNFDRFYNIFSDTNDVGIYLGPASQQDSIIAFESGASGEGIVMDSANSNQVLNSTFEDSMTADMTFERELPTRMGYQEAQPNQWNDTIQGCWFETGSGSGYSTWQEYIRIWMKTNQTDPSYPRHLIFRDLYFVLGNSGIAAQDANPHPLFECDSCRFISAENLDIYGNRWTSGVFMNGGQAFALSNFTIEDGYTQSTPLFTFANGSFGSESSYNAKFLNKSFQPIPTSCSSGDEFFYDFTAQNWAGCIGSDTGAGGTFAYFAQLDDTFHIPNALLPLDVSVSQLIVNGATTTNTLLAAIYAGTSGTNLGYWRWQTAGATTTRIGINGYDSTGTLRIAIDPYSTVLFGGATAGFVQSTSFGSFGVTYANLGGPSAGVWVYCTDCTIGSTCSGSGSGAWAFRQGVGAWTCPF